VNIDERIEALHVNIESLHANMGELFDIVRGLRGNISELTQTVRTLGETIGDLAHVATVHEKRLDRYEVTVVAFQEDVRDIKTELRAIRERLEGFGYGSELQ
jgi:ABC-type transporter Mla subunit MlaD